MSVRVCLAWLALGSIAELRGSKLHNTVITKHPSKDVVQATLMFYREARLQANIATQWDAPGDGIESYI